MNRLEYNTFEGNVLFFYSRVAMMKCDAVTTLVWGTGENCTYVYAGRL